MKKINKKAALGEGILNIYRLLLVVFVAIIVLSLSALFYEQYIEVKNTEARIMASEVVRCLAPKGVLDIDGLPQKDKTPILEYCGFSNVDRFYVRIETYGEKQVNLSQGDSGALWIRQLFDNKKATEGIKKYEPGYYEHSTFFKLSHEYTGEKSNFGVNTKIIVLVKSDE